MLNFIVVILAGIFLVLAIIGIIAALKDAGDGGCIAMICTIMCSVIMIGFAIAFQGTGCRFSLDPQ